MRYLLARYFGFAQGYLLRWKTSFRGATKIENNLNEVSNIFSSPERLAYLVWKYIDENIEIIEDLCVAL